MNLKETDKRSGMDSAGLDEVLMVTCRELCDEPPVFTKEIEFYLQILSYYQFHMKRLPIRCLLVRRLSINLSQGICLVTDEYAIWFHGGHFNSESVSLQGEQILLWKDRHIPFCT
jgi:hypothetical protein